MSVACGQEAAEHYGINYTAINAASDWVTGFIEGLMNVK